MVVLFWLELWGIFFLPTLGFELGTFGSLVLHSTTAPLQLLVFTSDNIRYSTLMQRDWWWDCSDWTCERFSFCPLLGFELGTSGCLVLHSTTAACQLLVFTSDNFRYLTLVERDWWWYCSDWTCEGFCFCPHRVWTGDLWISSPALYHCTAVTSVFTSVNFRYLTLVQRDWWWYCSDWTCERFSFCPQLGFELGTSGSLVLHSTTAHVNFCTSASYFLVQMDLVLHSLDRWEIFLFSHWGLTLGTSI